MRYFIVLLLLINLTSHSVYAQELRCNIQVNSSQIQGTNRQVFQNMQKAIFEFMNNTSWTNHIYTNEERIECNIMINISEQISADEFKGSMQIQTRRPVFGSSYSTVLLNFKDDNVHFNYVEFEPLEFSISSHTSNLASMLAYYAYIILGLDYDSFSSEGGTEYFQNAETIVNNAQNARESGWKAFESSKRNRYWLIENLMNENYSQLRECFYKYHRLGLDVMSKKVEQGRAEVLEGIKLLQEIYRKKPDPYMTLIKVFFDAKSDEIVNIFSEAYNEEKTRAFTILSEIDPTNASKYERIVKSNN